LLSSGKTILCSDCNSILGNESIIDQNELDSEESNSDEKKELICDHQCNNSFEVLQSNQNKEESDKDKKKDEKIDSNQNIPIIQESFQNNDLKCDQCNNSFDLYCEPKLLPCGNTICNDCESKIEKEVVNNQFNCKICLIYHLIIPNEKFPINKEKHAKITAEPEKEMPKSEDYIQLELNLNNIQSLILQLKDFESECINKLNEHCIEQRRLIQLETEIIIQKLQNDENKIEQVNESNEKLIDIIDDYELKYKNNFLTKAESHKSNLVKLIKKSNDFLNKKQALINQKNQITDFQIKIFNIESIDLQEKLNKKLKKLKNSIFNNNKIDFQPIQTNESIIGLIDYDPSFTVSCYIFNSILVISKIRNSDLAERIFPSGKIYQKPGTEVIPKIRNRKFSSGMCVIR